MYLHSIQWPPEFWPVLIVVVGDEIEIKVLFEMYNFVLAVSSFEIV